MGANLQPMNETIAATLLGEAVVAAWGALPQPIQERIFETAVLAAGPAAGNVRPRLAKFLHDRHPRTGHGTDEPGANDVALGRR